MYTAARTPTMLAVGSIDLSDSSTGASTVVLMVFLKAEKAAFPFRLDVTLLYSRHATD